MTVIPRGSSFQATVRNSKIEPYRWRRQFPSELEARKWELEALDRLSKGQVPDMGEASKQGDPTSENYRPNNLGELVEYMITHRWAGTKGEKAATINARHIVRIIGPKKALVEVTAHVINLAVEQLRTEGYPVSTINKKLSPLRVALDYAVEQDWLVKAPKIPFFKPGEGRIRVFSAAEEKAQLAWAEERGMQDLWDYIVVSYDTGQRQGEVLTNKPRNLLDLEGSITLWGAKTETDNGTKAGTTRRVPLTPRAAAVYERRMEGLKANELIFAFDKDELRRMWDKMRSDLGYTDDPEYVPHAMRHTFCSRLVNHHNVNLMTVKELAGHLRIETTCKYVHVDHAAKVKAIAALAGTPAPLAPREDSVYTRATTPSHTPHVAGHMAAVA